MQPAVPLCTPLLLAALAVASWSVTLLAAGSVGGSSMETLGPMAVEEEKAEEVAGCVNATEIYPCECEVFEDGKVEVRCNKINTTDDIDKALTPTYPSPHMYRFWTMYSTLGDVHQDILHGKTFEMVDMTSCGITSLARQALVGCTERLRVLRLSDNRLRNFTFEDLPMYVSLETLGLTTNLLRDASGLVGLPELPLTELYIGDNFISELHPDTFKATPHLSVLHLQKNRLSAIPVGLFQPLVELQILHLYKNNIMHLAAGTLWFNTPILRALDLRLNDLSTIDIDVFRGVDYNTRVDMGRNDFTHLYYDVFSPLLKNLTTEFGTLDLLGVDLVCDCELLWVVASDDFLFPLVYARCENGTYLDDLSFQAMAEECATNPLSQG